MYNIVRSQQVHSRRERNLNDGGRRLQHFTTRTIREKKRRLKEEGEQSTAEHGKAPFIDPEKATHNTPIPTILIGRQKIAELSKGWGKRRKERGRNEEVGWISYNSTAQHSLTRTKKRSDDYTVHLLSKTARKGEEGRGVLSNCTRVKKPSRGALR